jgi:hypothetical protein
MIMRSAIRICPGRALPLLWMIGALALAVGLPANPFPVSAQVLPGTPQPQPQGPGPVTTPPNQPLSAPTSGLPANIVTPSTTNQLEPSTGAATSFERARTFGNAGRGLPGMAGGPPVNRPMGAQDPTADYMRPPVVGPLFCDPAVNIAC